MTRRPRGTRLAFLLLRGVRFLVPRSLRNRWLAEWQAEIWHRARSGHGSLPRTLSAIPHAAVLRRQHWSPDVILRDLRYAARQLSKNPGLSLVITLTLALGIGANALVFSVLDTTVLNPLPFPHADRLVYLWQKNPQYQLMVSPSMETIRTWRQNVAAIEQMELVQGGVYTSRIAGDPQVVGLQLRLDEEPYTIIGVMPRSFRLQPPYSNAEIWTPLVERDDLSGIGAIGRLAAGATLALANEQLQSLGAPAGSQLDGWVGAASSQQEMAGSQYTSAVWALQGAVILVLLIACSNVANLLLARGATRHREMAVRAAIGGSRLSLVRQMLAETVLLACSGGVLGLLIAIGGVRLIDAWRPEELRYMVTLRLDPRAVLGTLAVTLLVGLLVGLLPALRTSGGQLAAQLADGTRAGTTGTRRQRLRSGLVIVQVALSTLLVVGAGLMANTFWQYQAIDPGFDPHHLLTLRVTPPAAAYPAESLPEFWDRLLQSVRGALGPAASEVTLALGLPPYLGINVGEVHTEGQPDQPATAQNDQIMAVMWGAPDALAAMRVRLLSGRWLTAEDAIAEDQHVLINESFARTTWPGQEATGKRFRIGEGDNPEDWQTVVGVVGDIKPFGLTTEMGKKQAFYPINMNSPSAFLVIRTPGDPLAVADSVRRAVWSVEPDAPIAELEAVSERLGQTIALPQFNALMMLLLAASAIGLALIGVYGVLSYTVADRTRELGLRMALGAKRPDVVRMVAGQGALLVGIGARWPGWLAHSP